MGFRFFHTLLWVGGLFYGVVPFIWKHAFSHSTNTISWADNLGSGMLVFLGLAAIGSFKWGILARFINIDVQGQRQLKRWLGLNLLGTRLNCTKLLYLFNLNFYFRLNIFWSPKIERLKSRFTSFSLGERIMKLVSSCEIDFFSLIKLNCLVLKS